MVNADGRRIWSLALLGALVAAALTVVVPAGMASATFTYQCSDYGLYGLKVDGAAPVGTYSLPQIPGGTATISNTRSTGKVFDWTSTFGLEKVIVTGSLGSKLYTYQDARSGTGLTTPTVLGLTAKITRVEFCYDGREAPTVSADTTSVIGARGVAISDIPLASLPASLLNQVAGADLVNDAGTGLRFSGTSLRYSGTGLRFSGTGLRYSGTGLRFSGTGLRFSGTSLRFSGTSLRFSGTGLRFSGTSLRFSGNGIGALVAVRSAGTSLRFSGTGLRFSDTLYPVADTPAWDVALSDLQPPAGYTWNDVFIAIDKYQGFPPQNVTFGQLLDALNLGFTSPAPAVIVALASASLLDLDPTGAVLRNVSLVGLLLGNTPLSSIPLPVGTNWCTVIDPEFTGTCTIPTGATVLGLNLAGLRSDNLPLAGIPLASVTLDPDSVLADLLVNSGVAGDLYVPAVAGESLGAYLVRGIDALNVPWEQLPLTGAFDVRQYALGSPVNLKSSWSQIGSGSTDVVATVPAGFLLAKGSPSCTTTSGSCTVTSTGTGPQTFKVQTSGSTTFQRVELKLTYRPRGIVGVAGTPAAGTFSIKAGTTAPASFPVAVTDPWSGQSLPPVDPDVLYFSNAGAGEIDNYDVDVSRYGPGSHVAVRLSNLTNDADLVLYRSAGTGLRFSGTGMRFSGTGLRFSGTGMRYSGGDGDESVTNRESETLEDVPIDQALLVEDVSATRSNTPEVAEGFTDPSTGRFKIQVSGFNQASTDYVMRVAVTQFADACPAATTPASATVTFGGTPNADTIVVYPRGRFNAADQTAIDAALARLNGFWPIQTATVSTTGQDWTTAQGSCSVFAANKVAESVAAAVQRQTTTSAVPIKHVMLIGGDEKLPFYRSPDTTTIANEATYASTIGGQNPLTAALSTQNLLTDDIYGDDDPWPFLNRLYFTPDRAVGRLVESSADIVGQIDRFIGAQGRIDTGRSFTAGYDFLTDVANEIDANLADVAANRTNLISDAWNSAELIAGLRGSGTGSDLKFASIQAHMDQGQLLTAAGNAQGSTPSASEVKKPSDVIPPGVKGAVLFTAGCHGGLDQPYASATRTDSWAKSLAGGAAAVYLANTGYGYGIDQPIVAYSEELLASFSDLLELNGLTVGQAAAFAKQQYSASQIEVDPYDEKSQMQLALYGVPMYSLTGSAAPPIAATSVVQETVIDPATGLASAAIDANVDFDQQTGADGTSYYGITQATLNNDSNIANAGLEASDGNPIQPSFTADITPPNSTGLIARGAIIESLASREANLDNPTIARAVVDNTTTERAVDSGVLIFPTAFATVHTEQTPSGPRGKLVVVPAQYNSTDENEQLLIDSFRVRTYFAPGNSPDVVRPQFRDVSANSVGNDLLLRATVIDPTDPARNVFGTGVTRVLIQYFDGNIWHPVEMFPANAARTEWSGGLQGVGPGGVFFVQAVDGAGNVSATANKGQNYVSGGQPAEAVAFVTGVEGDNGWFLGAVSVELKGASVLATTHQVSINGAAPVLYTGPFTLDTQGSNTVDFTGPGATPIHVVVAVDTQVPTVELANPIAVLSPGDTIGPAGIQECSDPVPGSGLRDLDPASASSCSVSSSPYPLTLADGTVIGPFTLSSVRGEDIAGNESVESQSAVILSGIEGDGGYYTTPVILGVIGKAALDATIKIGDAPAVRYSQPIRIEASAPIVVTVGDDVFTFPVNVDHDAPTAVASGVPLVALRLGDVATVTCAFGDTGGSGLAAVACGPNTGTNQASIPLVLDTSALVVDRLVTVSATDHAGNTTTSSFEYSVTDQERPTVIIDDLPAGPYRIGQVVPVTCRFSDTGGSGLASVQCGSVSQPGNVAVISTSFTVSALGPDQEFTASATDGAGNEATATVRYTATDQSEPTILNVAPLPVGPYTIGQHVVVTCTFADTGGSGLSSVTCGGTTAPATGATATLTVEVDTSKLGAGQPFVVSAIDGAGNEVSESHPYSVADQANPTATVSPVPVGPYAKGQVVPVTCTFTDAGGSFLKSVTCGGTTQTAPPNSSSLTVEVNVDTSTLGFDQVFALSATDGAFNSVNNAKTYSVTDQVKPTVSVSPVPAGQYQRGQVVPVTCTFADTGGSGLGAVTCGSQSGNNVGSLTANLDTATTGPKTFTATARDNAGNLSAPASYAYTVVDPLCDPQGDSPIPKGDIIRCAAVVNGDGTATISFMVAGTIASDGTQYRLQLATSSNSAGVQVKWAAGKITGAALRSARINANDPSRIDFVVDLGTLGCARGNTLYWSAQAQNGEKEKGVGFLDKAPNTGYFTLLT